MKIVIYFLIIFVYLSSSLDSKDIGLNFVVSGLGGANYFVRRGVSLSYTGWGESYGYEGEVQVIFKKENIGLGLSYGNIYETAVANEPYGSAVWTRKVERENYLIKFLISPNTKIKPWFGFGKDIFNIRKVELDFDLYETHYKLSKPELEGREIFQIICAGLDTNIWRSLLLSSTLRYGYNETNNTVKTTNFESWQFLIGVKYEFRK